MPDRYPIARLIQCVEHELALRRKVYPARVRAHFLTGGQAVEELALMQAVLQVLLEVQQQRAGQAALFPEETRHE